MTTDPARRQLDWKKVWGIARLVGMLIALVVVTFLFRRVPAVQVISVTPATALDDQFRPVEVTDSYAPSDTFFVSVELKGYRPGQDLRARWRYEGGEITTTLLVTESAGEGFAGFVLVNEEGDWPPGKYMVEIVLDDQVLGSAAFTVEPAPGP